MNEIKLDTKELDKIAAQLNMRREAVGRRMAFQIEKEAKQLAPKDTGALRNSIYTVTKDYNGYNPVSEHATEPHPTPSGNIIANVGPSVDYAEYQEFGTSKMGAQPYLTPAVEQVAAKYNDGKEWEELVK